MFYSESDIILPVIRFKKNIRKETFEDLPTKEEIRKVMTFANIKYQSVILLMLSSGMRASDIRALKYHDFLISLKDYIKLPKSGYLPIDVVVDLLEENRKDLIVPVWKLTAIKTSTPFITFSTPESLKLLINYLKIYNPTDPRQYLFPSKRYPDQPIGSRAFAYYFKWLNELADLGKPDRQIKFRSHALRKYFASTLSQAGVQQLTIDRLLAHSVGDLAEAYIKPTAKGLMDQYLPCIKALSIEDTEVHILESPEYKELKSLRKEVNEMKALMDKERKDKIKELPLPK
jgi:integrase